MTNLDDADVKNLIQDMVDIAGANGGFVGDVSIANVEGDIVGLAYRDKNGNEQNISLNLANLDLRDPNALINTIYHETTNFDDHDNDRTAHNRGNTADGIFTLKNFGNENTNNISHDVWMEIFGNDSVVSSGSNTMMNNVFNEDGEKNYQFIPNLQDKMQRQVAPFGTTNTEKKQTGSDVLANTGIISYESQQLIQDIGVDIGLSAAAALAGSGVTLIAGPGVGTATGVGVYTAGNAAYREFKGEENTIGTVLTDAGLSLISVPASKIMVKEIDNVLFKLSENNIHINSTAAHATTIYLTNTFIGASGNLILDKAWDNLNSNNEVYSGD